MEYKNKNYKISKNPTLLVVYKSGPIYKMLKYQEEWTLSRMAHLYLLVVVLQVL
jgi:hypothetical protein